jgi:hypothetical protein
MGGSDGQAPAGGHALSVERVSAASMQEEPDVTV